MTKYVCINNFECGCYPLIDGFILEKNIIFQMNKVYEVYNDPLEQEYYNDDDDDDDPFIDSGGHIFKINKDVFNKNFITEQQYRKMKLDRLNILSQN